MILKKILQWVFLLGFLNFAVFWTLSMLYGSADGGHEASGHFFLGNHGRFTEVTETQFQLSLWHGRSLWITHPLAIAAALWANHLDRKSP